MVYLVLVSMFLTQDWHVMPENKDCLSSSQENGLTFYLDKCCSKDIGHVILDIREVLELRVASCE